MKHKKSILALFLLLFFFVGCKNAEPGSSENIITEKPTYYPTVVDDSTEVERNQEEEVQISITQAAATPTPLPEVTVVMVGDVLLHTRVSESCQDETGAYDFMPLFSHVQSEISKADLAIVNQEVILGGEELGISGYPNFNAPFELGTALAEAGFDMVCHATNHALDKGKQGLLNCINYWKTSYPDMMVLGINETEEEQKEIAIYEQAGIKIAVLNYTYGTNGIELPKDMPYAVNLLEKESVIADIRRAKELSDFVIVCPHWGTEYQLTPDQSQEAWTQLFLENGVDLVLGTHPHVIEPIEWKTEETTGNQMLVYYSIGNFVNWTSGKGSKVSNRMVGGMAEITIGRSETGEAVITAYGVKPLVAHVESGYQGVTAYFLEDYTNELAEKNEIAKQDDSFSLDYCVDLCEQVWGELLQ